MADITKRLTQILKVKGDWEEVVNDCRATVKKSPLGHEPSSTFKKKILLAEHSPIRDISLKFVWPDIKYWVAMHWKTHIWESRVDSQRNDRQSRYDRNKAPQDALIDFYGDPNIQNTIDTWRKRLCFQASTETRRYAEDFKRALHAVEPEWSNVLVPNCVYRCGCCEMSECPLAKTGKGSYWDLLVLRTGGDILTDDLQKRYDLYNNVFWGCRTDQEVAKDG